MVVVVSVVRSNSSSNSNSIGDAGSS